MSKIEELESALAEEQKARAIAEEKLKLKIEKFAAAQEALESQNYTLQAKNKTLELFALMTELAEKNCDTDELLQSYIKGVCACTKWPLGHLFTIKQREQKAKKLEYKDIWHCDKGSAFDAFIEQTGKEKFKSGEGLSGQVLQSAEAVWFDDFGKQEGSDRAKVAQDKGIIQAVAIPIFRYNQIVAVAEFFSDVYDTHGSEIIKLVLTVGNHLSTILERRYSEEQFDQSSEKLKSTKMQLIQSSKLAAIGELAAGVAHEINNPIAYVLANCRALSKYIKNLIKLVDEIDAMSQQNLFSEEVIQKIHEAKSQAKVDYIIQDVDPLMKDTIEGLDRVTDIVASLKNYSRIEQENKQLANINECIESTLKVIWNQVKYKCSIKKFLSDVPDIECYPGRLNQVLMNLIVNASQAIAEKGVITIKTYVEEEQIHIIVSDTGAGIPQDILDKIFDPFFTTKEVGSGTGLGLSISYEIIKQHAGTINCESEMGKGTTFHITIPINQAKSS